jgi:hypothetical protein
VKRKRQDSAYVDREARDRLAAAAEEYLSEWTTSWEFEDQTDAIRFKTKDQTVRFIGHQFWLLLDDTKPSKVILARDAWNFVQRLLLILRSDSQILVQTVRVWSWHQLVALAALAWFAAFALQTGWGKHLLILSIPFGAVSILLSRSKRAVTDAELRKTLHLAPFGSLAEVFATRRQVSGFKKQQYPPHLGQRRMRSRFMEWFQYVPAYLGWSVVSPAILTIQLVPRCRYLMSVAPPPRPPVSSSTGRH